MSKDHGSESDSDPTASPEAAGDVDANGVGVPAGPGHALVLAARPLLRQQLTAAGWQVRTVPIPGGDLTGFSGAAVAGSADLVAVDDALSPLHHADKRAALAVVVKWLRPGGGLWLCEPLEPPWAGAPGGLRRTWHRLLHGRIDPHYGPASVRFWCDACQHAGFEDVEAAEAGGRLTLRATRRKPGSIAAAQCAPSGE